MLIYVIVIIMIIIVIMSNDKLRPWASSLASAPGSRRRRSSRRAPESRFRIISTVCISPLLPLVLIVMILLPLLLLLLLSLLWARSYDYSRDHLLIQDSSRLSIEMSEILSRKGAYSPISCINTSRSKTPRVDSYPDAYSDAVIAFM